MPREPTARFQTIRHPTLRVFTGCVLLAAVAVLGAYLSRSPGPTPIDRLANRIIPAEWSVHWLVYIVDTGRPRVVLPGVIVCGVIAFFWDRRRAVACLVGPAVAVGITEYLAKPAVGRMLGGSLSYPSGHMTAAVALITAFVFAVPPRLKVPAVVLGACASIVVGVALIALRWHWLTDVLAGVAVPVATMLVVDTAVHLVPLRRSPARSHPGPAVGGYPETVPGAYAERPELVEGVRGTG